MKIIFISTISIAILSTYTIAATTRSDGIISIEHIDVPYTEHLDLLATKRAVSNVVIHTNERLKIIDTNFIVNAQSISTVGSNLGAAGDAIQANHNALVDVQTSNRATEENVNNVKRLSQVATLGTAVNAQSISTVGSNLGAAGDAIQANHNALVNDY